MAIVAALPLLVAASLVPLPLVLPVLSITFLAAATLLALLARCSGSDRKSDKVTVWDVCGACAFIGLAAAILSEPENVITAFAPFVGG
jgi:hypothetical protein